MKALTTAVSALVIASLLTGCFTVGGAVLGGRRAADNNEERAERVQHGDKDVDAPSSIPRAVMLGGVLGVVLDVAAASILLFGVSAESNGNEPGLGARRQ